MTHGFSGSFKHPNPVSQEGGGGDVVWGGQHPKCCFSPYRVLFMDNTNPNADAVMAHGILEPASWGWGSLLSAGSSSMCFDMVERAGDRYRLSTRLYICYTVVLLKTKSSLWFAFLQPYVYTSLGWLNALSFTARKDRAACCSITQLRWLWYKSAVKGEVSAK